jgi:hypothetical protein
VPIADPQSRVAASVKAMSASVASAVAGATIFSTSPTAKSVCDDAKVAVVPAAATVAVRNSVPFS